MTLAQDKTIGIMFCDPIQEGVWNRLQSNDLDDNDFLWIAYEDLQGEDLIKVANNLESEFQEVFNAGYLQGVNLMKGQSVT